MIYIKNIKFNNFRCFSSKMFNFSPNINILTGNNGCGKTSVVEGISYLCLGKSFRGAKDKDVLMFNSVYFNIISDIEQENTLERVVISYDGVNKRVKQGEIVYKTLSEYVGKYKLDEILENKDKISDYVFSKLKEKESELFVEIIDAGVKDIILPGEIRAIMNTVLIAEKRAQANVITRREEVASTRSLLNTAKLMDENQTLYKLKELEYVERICENVGNINLNGNTDVLTQLTGILKANNA